MNFRDKVHFGAKRLPLILQTEGAECGLACLGMVAGYHHFQIDLAALRARFSLSLKGANLEQIVRYADSLHFSTRPLRLELEQLCELQTPCILHWNLNHFVVLKKVGRKGIVIHDPAVGVRSLSLDEVSACFTGVALELTPAVTFRPMDVQRRVSLRGLIGKVTGLRRALLLIFVMAIALELMALLSPMFNQWVVDEVLVSADRDLLDVLVIGFGLMLVLQSAIGLARGWTVTYFSTHLNLQWSANVFSHLMRLPVVWFEKRHLGDVVSRFGSIGAIQQTLTSTYIEAVLDGLLALATLVMMLLYDARLSAIVVCAVIVYAMLRMLAYGPLRQANFESMELSAKVQSCFLETMRGVQAIKLFGRELDRRSRWLNLSVDAINRNVRTQKFMLWFQIANTAVFGLQNLLVFWLGARLIMDEKISVGMLFAFSAYSMQFSGRMSALIDKYIDFRMLSLHAERLADIVLEPAEELPAHDVNVLHMTPSIEFVNVSFRYGDGEPWILRDLNLTISAQESMAIIGPEVYCQ